MHRRILSPAVELLHHPTQTAAPEHAIASAAPAASSKSPLQCAGMNRHEAENERVSRERTSDLLGLESCVATARDPTKRRQRIGGVGIQLRYIQEKKET